MFVEKICYILIVLCCVEIVWCGPWAQRTIGFNNSFYGRDQHDQNPQYDGNQRDENKFSPAPTRRPLYPTLNPSYNNPQSPYSHNDDYQRPVNPQPLQPNLDNDYNGNNHQSVIPPFHDNGPAFPPNSNEGYFNPRPYEPHRNNNSTLPTYPPNRANQNNYGYNNNNNYDDRYQPNSGSNFHPTPRYSNNYNNSRNYNPQNPYYGNSNDGAGNAYGNQRPQTDDRRNSPYDGQRPISFDHGRYPPYDQRPVSPYPAQNSNDFRGQSGFNPSSNNVISNRNSFQPSAPQMNHQAELVTAKPDYDVNGVALAPFPNEGLGTDRSNFNFQNLHRRQQTKYLNPTNTFNKDTLHVPLAPLAMPPLAPF